MKEVYNVAAKTVGKLPRNHVHRREKKDAKELLMSEHQQDKQSSAYVCRKRRIVAQWLVHCLLLSIYAIVGFLRIQISCFWDESGGFSTPAFTAASGP